MNEIREACGIMGIYAPQRMRLAELIYYGLFALQHRGQESAGIVVNDDGVFTCHKGAGLVGEVFSYPVLESLGEGNIAVGHTRYSTTGVGQKENAQPLLINHRKGCMALAHNGNLTNSYDLRCKLEEKGAIFHTTTDSEVIAYQIVQERLKCASIEQAVSEAMNTLEGAYSLVISSPAKLIAARDPHGFRPLCMGKLSDGSIVFASETCALDTLRADFLRDVLPGEIITVDEKGIHEDRSHCATKEKSLCVFEYIYFSRPDSVVDGTCVSTARQRAGMFLAQKHPLHGDVVVGVPDSGLDAAIGYAQASGIPYAIGFTKNKYIARTFISPSPSLRESAIRLKLNPIRSVLEGKRVVLIDDSIVRGTTCHRTVELARQAGAKEVHMLVSAPPFVAPCFYGTDIDSAENLIANRHSVEEIARMIGADSLGYLSLEQVRSLAPCSGPFCTACFGGCYPTPVPEHQEKDCFAQKIHDT